MRFILTCILLLMAGGVSGLDVDSLLIQSVGGPAAYERIASMKSAYSEGDVLLNGTPGTFISIQAPPDLMYSQLNLGAISMTQGYDGETGWTTDLAGNPVVMSDLETTEMLKASFVPSYSYLIKGWIPGGKEYRGIVQSYDRQLHEVAFFPLNEDTVLAHFDVETGRMTDYQATQDELLATITLGEYQQVDGVWMPFYSRLETEDAPLVIEQRARVCEFDRALPADQFSAPAVTYQAGFPEGMASVTAKIDYRAGHIKVRASVNGVKTGWFILDSGASASIIDSDFAADLDLLQVGSLPARGAAGYDEFSMVTIDSLLIGGLVLHNVTAGVSDLEMLRIHGPGDTRFGGIIGYDFISQFPIMIDYAGRQLTIFNPDKFVAPDSGYTLPFKFYQRVPVIQGELLGIPGDMLVDLGNPFGLILHQPFIRKHDLTRRLDNIKAADQPVGGIGGSTKASTAYVASFKMGEILLTSIRAILAEDDGGMVGSEQLAGNIGNLVLENFKVLLDYSAKKIILYASDKPSEPETDQEPPEKSNP